MGDPSLLSVESEELKELRPMAHQIADELAARIRAWKASSADRLTHSSDKAKEPGVGDSAVAVAYTRRTRSGRRGFAATACRASTKARTARIAGTFDNEDDAIQGDCVCN